MMGPWPRPIRWIAAAIVGALLSLTAYFFIDYVCLRPFVAWYQSAQIAETGTTDSVAGMWLIPVLIGMTLLCAMLAGACSAAMERSGDFKFFTLLSIAYGALYVLVYKKFSAFTVVISVAVFLGCMLGDRLSRKRAPRVTIRRRR